jgi:glycerol uptake facilitator-like aquaporin
MPQFFLYFVTPLVAVPDTLIYIYIYVIGPIVDALLVALLYDYVSEVKELD